MEQKCITVDFKFIGYNFLLQLYLLSSNNQMYNILQQIQNFKLIFLRQLHFYSFYTYTLFVFNFVFASKNKCALFESVVLLCKCYWVGPGNFLFVACVIRKVFSFKTLDCFWLNLRNNCFRCLMETEVFEEC